MFTSIFISVSIYIASKSWFHPYISNFSRTPWGLIWFSPFLYLWLRSLTVRNTAPIIFIWAVYSYGDNLTCCCFPPPPHGWSPHFAWLQGSTSGYHTPLRAIMDFLLSPQSIPTPPSVDTYLAQPQIMSFGSNCLGREEEEGKGQGMGEEEMRKKGRSLRGWKGQIKKRRRK